MYSSSVHYICGNINGKEMKKVEVIFSMRDWRQGSILLVDISIEDNLVLSETHEFWLDTASLTPEKTKVINKLVKRGQNLENATKYTNEHYEYVSKHYAGVAKIAEVIMAL